MKQQFYIVLFLLACILGVAAKGGDNYRDADSPEAEFTDVQTLVKSRHHSGGKSSMKAYDKDTSGKSPKSSKKSSKSNPSNTPAANDTTGGQDETGPSTDKDVNPAEETLGKLAYTPIISFTYKFNSSRFMSVSLQLR